MIIAQLNSTQGFAVQQALCKAWQQCQLTLPGLKPAVNLGIASTHVRLMDLGTMPPCSYWQRYTAVWQHVRQASWVLDPDVYYDIITLPYTKGENRVFLMVAKADDLNERLQCLANVGLQAHTVDLNEMAQLRCLKLVSTARTSQVMIKLLSEEDWVSAVTQFYQQQFIYDYNEGENLKCHSRNSRNPNKIHDPLRAFTLASQLENNLTHEYRKKLVTACGLAMHA